MRVLLVTGSLPPMRCGVGDYTQELAARLSQYPGIEVGVLTSIGARLEESPQDFEIFALIRSWRLSEIWAVRKFLRQWRPDVMHVQFPTQGFGRRLMPWFVPLLGWLSGIRVVQTWHEYYAQRGLRLLKLFATKGLVPGALVVVRPNYERHMSRLGKLALRNKKTRFIPNASAIPAVTLTDAEKAGIRSPLARVGEKVLVYFGFMYPPKRVELLFRIADPAQHHIVLIGDINPDDPYHRSLIQIAESEPWRGKTTFTGFLPSLEVARIIAAADAVVLPFMTGGGEWNTSIHGAQAQGTFVLTTSTERQGYDSSQHTYFAVPDNVDEMRKALADYAGRRLPLSSHAAVQTWAAIADAHVCLYRELTAAS